MTLPFRFMHMIYHVIDTDYEVNYEREIVFDSIGENIALDWVHNKQYDNDSQPIIIICPGLTGEANSSYVKYFYKSSCAKICRFKI